MILEKLLKYLSNLNGSLAYVSKVYATKAITFFLPYLAVKSYAANLDTAQYNALILTLSLSMIAHSWVNFGQDIRIISRFNKGDDWNNLLQDYWSIRFLFLIFFILITILTSPLYAAYLIVKVFLLSFSLKFVSQVNGRVLDISIIEGLYVIGMYIGSILLTSIVSILSLDVFLTGSMFLVFSILNGKGYYQFKLRLPTNLSNIANYGIGRAALDSQRPMVVWVVGIYGSSVLSNYVEAERLVYPIMAFAGILAQVVYLKNKSLEYKKLLSVAILINIGLIITILILEWYQFILFGYDKILIVGLLGTLSVLIGLPLFEYLGKQEINNNLSLIGGLLGICFIVVFKPTNMLLNFMSIYLVLLMRIFGVFHVINRRWIKR